MSEAVLKKRDAIIGPGANGTVMTPQEFDRAEFEEGWRYELINGVLIVSPIPSLKEVDPNEELGYLLRKYQAEHPRGSSLDFTAPERTIHTKNNRRRVDRAIWAGLGRLPRKNEPPTVLAEFVSKGKRNRQRDYETKRDEYMEIKVAEYWIIDRFDRCMVVFTTQGGKIRKRVIRENQVYKTHVLPGFVVPLARLLALADRWTEEEE
ncbi:MAG TPA: Uma2 family endonuclease [Gemmataceae bacterium]|nr:Uma2 family endonuclease [Gemmataceae bacterium]